MLPETWNVSAPVSGLVLKVKQEGETIVQAGAPILEIGDPLDLEIVVDVPSTDAAAIQPGVEVVIENWGGQGTLDGRAPDRAVRGAGRVSIDVPDHRI